MSWSPADDEDDYGRHCPGPFRRTRATSRPQCQPGCCGIGPRLCEEGNDE